MTRLPSDWSAQDSAASYLVAIAALRERMERECGPSPITVREAWTWPVMLGRAWG